ncbi:hypothetical protein SARC_00435 [Sphaeroforma arctica JP610]|uniref:RNA helicase n=1 Tax=Sphaeroforma arctica JP610 TaxID=667725 RepID=A0A0L0GGJ9_9EUKA|nr:hypothetical protein SARC_00435 [Sphaeroforma arctica JP610]KNC87453.1 hypothetical protein SARC_00435 [Sphaeroforma arctica JP610]|eukprot:XP_014161355.1 hypothetical protein SARC_00435 [Sphaeroforma arctica JP610]
MPLIRAHNVNDKNKTRSVDVQVSEDVTFEGLLLSAPVLKGLHRAGYIRPSPIQLQAIPLGKCGLDLIAQAKSGTGKTCVFTVVVLEGLQMHLNGTQALVLAPTREIANQIHDVFLTIGACIKGLRCVALIGGNKISENRKQLKTNRHVAVGTPGRVVQLINEGLFVTKHLTMFVLDEADKLMDADFKHEIGEVHFHLPESIQFMVFSATYSPSLAKSLDAYLNNPVHVRLSADDPSLVNVRQYTRLLHVSDQTPTAFETKLRATRELLTRVPFQQCMVFTNSFGQGQKMAEIFNHEGLSIEYISGQMQQDERSDVIKRTRNMQLRVLVSTDLTARGVDLENVNLVINFDIPKSADTYMHRVGRSGRFGSLGVAVTMVMEKEANDWHKLCKAYDFKTCELGRDIPPDLLTRACVDIQTHKDMSSDASVADGNENITEATALSRSTTKGRSVADGVNPVDGTSSIKIGVNAGLCSSANLLAKSSSDTDTMASSNTATIAGSEVDRKESALEGTGVGESDTTTMVQCISPGLTHDSDAHEIDSSSTLHLDSSAGPRQIGQSNSNTNDRIDLETDTVNADDKLVGTPLSAHIRTDISSSNRAIGTHEEVELCAGDAVIGTPSTGRSVSPNTAADGAGEEVGAKSVAVVDSPTGSTGVAVDASVGDRSWDTAELLLGTELEVPKQAHKPRLKYMQKRQEVCLPGLADRATVRATRNRLHNLDYNDTCTVDGIVPAGNISQTEATALVLPSEGKESLKVNSSDEYTEPRRETAHNNVCVDVVSKIEEVDVHRIPIERKSGREESQGGIVTCSTITNDKDGFVMPFDTQNSLASTSKIRAVGVRLNASEAMDSPGKAVELDAVQNERAKRKRKTRTGFQAMVHTHSRNRSHTKNHCDGLEQDAQMPGPWRVVESGVVEARSMQLRTTEASTTGVEAMEPDIEEEGMEEHTGMDLRESTPLIARGDTEANCSAAKAIAPASGMLVENTVTGQIDDTYRSQTADVRRQRVPVGGLLECTGHVPARSARNHRHRYKRGQCYVLLNECTSSARHSRRYGANFTSKEQSDACHNVMLGQAVLKNDGHGASSLSNARDMHRENYVSKYAPRERSGNCTGVCHGNFWSKDEAKVRPAIANSHPHMPSRGPVSQYQARQCQRHRPVSIYNYAHACTCHNLYPQVYVRPFTNPYEGVHTQAQQFQSCEIAPTPSIPQTDACCGTCAASNARDDVGMHNCALTRIGLSWLRAEPSVDNSTPLSDMHASAYTNTVLGAPTDVNVGRAHRPTDIGDLSSLNSTKVFPT